MYMHDIVHVCTLCTYHVFRRQCTLELHDIGSIHYSAAVASILVLISYGTIDYRSRMCVHVRTYIRTYIHVRVIDQSTDRIYVHSQGQKGELRSSKGKKNTYAKSCVLFVKG